jgi:hypothetical protein
VGQVISLSVIRALREGNFTATEEDAARWRGYCAWKMANYFPDRASLPRKPPGKPALGLVRAPDHG